MQNKTVSVIAPAGRIDADALEKSAEIWRSWGVNVKIMPHVTGFEHMFFSAPKELRAQDLNMACADEETDFIICARGGYGCAELHDLIDWELLKKNQKIIIGYSDITALHLMMLRYNAGIPVTGAMFIKAPELFAADPENYSSFCSAVDGHNQVIAVNSNQSFCGRGIVCNLAMLASLCGTELLCDFQDKCLILEDLNEPPYKIHRMLNQLEQSGIFRKISALGFGEFLDCGNASECRKIFDDFTEKYNFPVFHDLPIGHGRKIHALNWMQEMIFEKIS